MNIHISNIYVWVYYLQHICVYACIYLGGEKNPVILDIEIDLHN